MENNNFTDEDKKFMNMALKLAEKGRGKTRPNPMVGTVIVKEGKRAATGYHQKAGGPHAEIEAISSAKMSLRGARMYVTLEPCTIYGRTPPCADEIIKQGFSEVIVASLDPNPKVYGQGIKKLKAAGIKVRSGLFKDRAAVQNEEFFKNMRTGMPLVTLKAAVSLDGKLAASSGDSKWITSQPSRLMVQRLRKETGCVLTGIGTVEADNPFLFPRESLDSPVAAKHMVKNFSRVVLDPDLRIRPESNLAQTAQQVETIIVTASGDKEKADCLRRQGLTITMMEPGSKRFNLKDVLGTLYSKHGITSILIEAGPGIGTAFLKEGQIDKFFVFVAPIILGQNRYSMFSDLGLEKVCQSYKLEFKRIKKIGEDLLITAYPRKKCLQE
ncbi:MAG: bifunctional diaminohydroxyphosphoribosylaminopyrimidine deaminase/5-amino-6-(5-phosphoribosylamino)uracil reductase RibD [Actinomycetia bacterium]|nr:bifunctional diaminohydroxyphosphoribosylaminopyrimidine deaminase/5-amino-6-(5-phosphoribosylamino)uracil reductase RibD [Actinomycetes bacterium]